MRYINARFLPEECQNYVPISLKLVGRVAQEDNWEDLEKNEDIVIKVKCLTFDNRCLGVTHGKVNNDPVKSRGQCIFPFKHQNVEYMDCTMADHDGLWCATSVDKDLEWQTRGFCSKACPFEGTYFLYFHQNKFSAYLLLLTIDFSITI